VILAKSSFWATLQLPENTAAQTGITAAAKSDVCARDERLANDCVAFREIYISDNPQCASPPRRWSFNQAVSGYISKSFRRAVADAEAFSCRPLENEKATARQYGRLPK
jgi:hypothetical protein